MLPAGRLRWAVIPLALGVLLVLAAVLLTPYANARLARALENLFENGLLLKARHLEVDLLGRRAEAYNLVAVVPNAPIGSVEEIRLEGVSLYALIFGVDDAALADTFLVRGARPGGGRTALALERAEITDLSGPFPGLLSLLRDPYGRAFAPAALRMRAGVLSLEGLFLENPDLTAAVGAMAAVNFSLSGNDFAMLRKAVYAQSGDSCSFDFGMMARRATPEPAAFLSERAEDREAERLRLLSAGMYLERAVFHGFGLSSRSDGVKAALLTLEVFSDRFVTRLAAGVKGLKSNRGAGRPFLVVADGDLAGGLRFEAVIAGDTIRQTLQLGLAKNGPPHVFRSGNLYWRQVNPKPLQSVSFFPALELSGPALVSAHLDVEQQGGLRGMLGSSRYLPAQNPDAAYLWLAQEAVNALKEEAPGFYSGKAGEQLDDFIMTGGSLRISLEPSSPLPLLQLPDALRHGLPVLGWKQTLNGAEAK